MTVLASIPSPPESVWYLGPLPIRAYAIAIGLGILAAWWILDRRYTAKGGPPDTAIDVAVWMVPFGIIGGRLYHVFSSPDAYFGPDGNPARIIEIWNGGLGIWGAIPLGGLGAWIALRRRGLRLAPFADALAPGLLVAQGIGRLGNYFNQELYGAPTTLPWGLEIDDRYLRPGYESGTLFHPTFLYEMLWNFAAAAFIIWAQRRFQLKHGRVFWLYVMSYTLGRVWIEYLRIDEAELVLGLRLNVWTSIVVFLVALTFFVIIGRRTRGVPETLWLPGREPAADDAGDDDDGDDDDGEAGAGTDGASRDRDEDEDATARPAESDAVAEPDAVAERGATAASDSVTERGATAGKADDDRH
ncbi:prolipoprotein diacylglyceryl transferase [Georgenia faecalis]|uniref:Phosphatidylglycerol--prolipoprotein diacylglyceryl transferase n=1 Tax=Georgenia faecalis TaxID=2483799 RepID=A0ABV9DAU8_9MICO|nr:prolipoprotein diacylglyceryl transferase [Georgenia faecalis]